MEENKNEAAAAPPKAIGCKTSELFQFLKGSDRLLLLFGSVTALLAGLAMPAFVFFFGRLTDSFDPNRQADDTLSKYIISVPLLVYFYFKVLSSPCL